MTRSLTFRLMFFGASLGLSAGAGAELSSTTSIEVFVDQAARSLSGPKVTVPFDARLYRFFVAPQPGQVRYQLKGYDTDWNQRLGEMFFVVRFLNQNGDQISRETFRVVGRSPGWNDAPEKSAFKDHREILTVPAGADRISVGTTSAAPEAVVGIYTIKDVSIRSQAKNGQAPRVLLENSFLADRSLNWRPSGNRPSMATSYTEDGTGNPVFKIVDTDIKTHADWNTAPNDLEVTPGETLEITWKEAHSIGMGDPLSAYYGRLPAGKYEFVVEQLGAPGTPPKKASSMILIVPLPFWKEPLFWTACLVGLAAIGSVIARQLIRKKIRLHLQQAQLISDERLRIARDLHDDLGTRLSHISLLGAYAESTSTDLTDARANFHQIAGMSRELITALSETVWMLNAKNDKLDSLIDFLCRQVSELCKPANIRCRIDAMPVTSNMPIRSEIRHNISLSFKEAVNNALKHSSASEIQIRIRFESPLLKVSVADNGVGLSQEERTGNGLGNIRQRMGAINGSCSITERPDGGVIVILEAPIL